MQIKQNGIKPSQDGFSLIEVALALLVASVGLLSLIGLIPSGLNAGKSAIGDSRTAIFADEILKCAMAVCDTDDPRMEWSRVDGMNIPGESSAGIPPVAYNWWKNANDNYVIPDNTVRTIVYEIDKLGTSAVEDIVTYALRYKMDIGDVANVPGLKYFRLEVWDGEFGPLTGGQVFYTEKFQTIP